MDAQTLFEFSPMVALIVPIVLGLVEVAKRLNLPSKYAPLASILIGIGLVALTGVIWQAVIVQGIIVGLAASGLWSGVKTGVAAVRTTPPSGGVA